METESGRNIALFRFAAVAILILIFIATATTKIWELRIIAERTNVAFTVGSIKSALSMQLAALVSRGELEHLPQFHHSNPIDLFQPDETTPNKYSLPSGISPTNYMGEFFGPPEEQLPGSWYFDLQQSALIYHARFTKYLINDNQRNPELIRFQLQLKYEDTNNDDVYTTGVDYPKSMGLEPLDNYSWRPLE